MAGGEAESGERDASCHGAEGEDVEPSASVAVADSLIESLLIPARPPAGNALAPVPDSIRFPYTCELFSDATA